MTTGLEVRIQQGRERPEVNRVATTLNEVVLSLKEIDHVHLLRGTRATWVMADMRKEESDLIMRLEARFVPARRDPSDMLVPVLALVEGAHQLQQQPTVPPLFSPMTVTRLSKLAAPRDGVQSVALATYNGSVETPVVLDDQVRMNADTAVRPYEVSWGTISGTLSGVQDRSKPGLLKVTLRVTGGQAVDGYVPEPMEDHVRDAWRHRVMMGGKVRRNSRGQAIRIDVEQIERLPEDNSGRPRTADLLGVAADWLEGLSVDRFIERLRDA